MTERDYWPTRAWLSADPAAVGMDGALLSNLGREIQVRYRSINACLVVRNGYLAFEKYSNGFGPDDSHLVASVTKSFISALIGIAIQEDYIDDVDQKALDFFPEFKAAAGDPLKRQLTIQHLLTMTAGFQWRTGARLHELYIDRMRRSSDWLAFIWDLPVHEKSVGVFQYNSAATHLLSAIITRSTGRCAEEFAAKYLFTPLGIQPPFPDVQHTFSQEDVFRNRSGGWSRDPQGNTIGGWGLNLTPADMARFGFLYLNGGRWDSEQIVPRQWVEDSISPHTTGYGYQWWLRNVNGEFVFAAVGQGGQHIFCVPRQDLVVVVASRLDSRWRDRWVLLKEFVLPAIIG